MSCVASAARELELQLVYGSVEDVPLANQRSSVVCCGSECMWSAGVRKTGSVSDATLLYGPVGVVGHLKADADVWPMHGHCARGGQLATDCGDEDEQLPSAAAFCRVER